MLDAIERGNGSQSKSQDKSTDKQFIIFRGRKATKKTHRAFNADGCEGNDGIEIFLQLIFYQKIIDVSAYIIDIRSFLKLAFVSTALKSLLFQTSTNDLNGKSNGSS